MNVDKYKSNIMVKIRKLQLQDILNGETNREHMTFILPSPETPGM